MANAAGFITIVSGLPRSGTSLMMQMLAAWGLPAFTDCAQRAMLQRQGLPGAALPDARLGGVFGFGAGCRGDGGGC